MFSRPALMLQWQIWVVSTETIWYPGPEIFAIWLHTEKKFNSCPGVLRLPANIYIVKNKSPSPDGLLNYPDRNVSLIKLATLSLSPLYVTLQTKSFGRPRNRDYWKERRKQCYKREGTTISGFTLREKKSNLEHL